MHRWYPSAEIIGTDRDSNFIRFAKEKAPHIEFSEEDATSLSFANDFFDVTVSNTVAEHIEPSAFFGEQYRVLKPNGVCLVLSARRGINIVTPCIAEQSAFEKEIWARVQRRCAELDRQYGVCAYPMNEAEYPNCMEKFGFKKVSTEYITVNLTPDNPCCSKENAYAMFRANQQTALDAITTLERIASDIVSRDELKELARLTDEKYNKRRALYDSGIRQWDTNVSVTMILRGIK